MTSERLLDGREQEHPLADVLAAAAAPASPRELRREPEVMHAFAYGERASRHAAAAHPPARPAGSRREAFAAALRPVPLAKTLVAATAAVAVAFAVASAVTGPGDPVDASSPAALNSALAESRMPKTAGGDGTTTTTASPDTDRSAEADRQPPAPCVAWWHYARRHQGERTWPTTWPSAWPTTWPSTWPTDGPDDSTQSPAPRPTASPGASPGVTDREAWRACRHFWRLHHHRDGDGDRGDQSWGGQGTPQGDASTGGGEGDEDRSGDDTRPTQGTDGAAPEDLSGPGGGDQP